MKRSRRFIAWAAGAALLAACAATAAHRTRVTGVWQDAHFAKKSAHFLVISLSDEPGIREKVEAAFVHRLGKDGVRAQASSELMPAEQKIDRQTVRAALAGRGFDAVLVSRLIGVSSNMTYVPPQPNTSFDTGFLRGLPIVTAPGRMEHSSVVSLQIDLYDPDGAGRLVWSLTSRTLNPDNATQVIDEVADAVARDLKARGLI